MDAIKVLEFIFGGVGAVALFWSGLRGNLSNSTIALLKANKEASDAAIKRLEDDSKDKQTQISMLSGQIQMLKDIPLAQISKSLEVVSDTHKDMQDFLKAQQSQSAAVADGIAEKVITYLKDTHYDSTH